MRRLLLNGSALFWSGLAGVLAGIVIAAWAPASFIPHVSYWSTLMVALCIVGLAQWCIYKRERVPADGAAADGPDETKRRE